MLCLKFEREVPLLNKQKKLYSRLELVKVFSVIIKGFIIGKSNFFDQAFCLLFPYNISPSQMVALVWWIVKYERKKVSIALVCHCCHIHHYSITQSDKLFYLCKNKMLSFFSIKSELPSDFALSLFKFFLLIF